MVEATERGGAVTERVVIAAFRSPSEAAVAGTALDDAGIAAEVRPRSDELVRLCADAFDEGFDVIVNAPDAENALALLSQIWREDAAIDVIPKPRCPECGSDDLVRLPRLRIFLIAALILFPAGVLTGQRDLFLLLIVIIGALLAIAPDQRCRSCGERSRSRVARTLPAAPPPAIREQREPQDLACPQCGSTETALIGRRKERAWTLLVNFVIPPTLLVWPFLRRYRCSTCGHEWR